jgi:hypothetical protein
MDRSPFRGVLCSMRWIGFAVMTLSATAAPPGGSFLGVTLPASPSPPTTENLVNVFANNTSPTGDEIRADSLSLLLNGKRWFPISGEIHLARVPADQWREQLLRMKAGGLDSVAVYGPRNFPRLKALDSACTYTRRPRHGRMRVASGSNGCPYSHVR